MTLLDVDRTGDDRGRPMPHTHDVIDPAAVLARGTNSVNYVTPASTQSVLQGGKNGQFTIVQVGDYTSTNTYSFTAPSNTFANFNQSVYSQAHNLGYIPGVVGYEVNNVGQYTLMPYSNYLAFGGGGSGLWYTFSVYVDITNVYITLSCQVYNGTVNFAAGFVFKWYLLYQEAN